MDYHLHTLSSGIRLVFYPIKSQVAHVGVMSLAGTRFDPDDKAGLAHFLEHSIFKGTERRKPFHILNRVDSIGGELNAYTTKEEIVLYASFPKEFINRSLELLNDISFNSIYPEKEIEKEKDIVIDEINSYLDSPSEYIFDEFEDTLFEGHPLGKNILGTSESVTNIKRSDLLHFVENRFIPENMVVSIVGDYKWNDLIRKCEKYIVPKFHSKSDLNFDDSFQRESFIKKTNRANYQSHIMIGTQAYNIHDSKRRGLILLNNMLGGPSLNSRLVLNIREKFGFTYNIESNYTPYSDLGMMNIYAGTDKKYMNKTIKLIEKELKIFREKKLTPHQLERAKIQLKGNITLSEENNLNQMLALGKSVLFNLDIESLETVFQAIDDITPEQMLEIANEVFDPNSLNYLIYEVED
ncbi:MAG: insulinase family protein [Crocinitomicaceae bacterium]|nr:insulinase family protein [Crocinitomicaceae bacterium]